MSRTMMQITKGMRRTKLTIKIVKEVGNMNKNVAIQSTRAHTARMPQVVTVAGLSSMADLLNLVIPRSITIQRNYDFTVKVNHMVMSISAPAHWSMYAFCHLQHFIPLQLLLCIIHLPIQILLSIHSM